MIPESKMSLRENLTSLFQWFYWSTNSTVRQTWTPSETIRHSAKWELEEIRDLYLFWSISELSESPCVIVFSTCCWHLHKEFDKWKSDKCVSFFFLQSLISNSDTLSMHKSVWFCHKSFTRYGTRRTIQSWLAQTLSSMRLCGAQITRCVHHLHDMDSFWTVEDWIWARI